MGGLPEPHEATRLLHRIADGDEGARDRLFGLVYDELHRLAQLHMDRQESGHTLQPTALVHEAWLKLAGQDDVRWQDSEHFLSFASRVMRSVLVDHARRRKAQKRGGEKKRVPLDAALDGYEERGIDVVDLNDAMERMAKEEPELVGVVDLRFFGGLTMEESAAVLGVSLSTAERTWRLARMWLRNEVDPGAAL